jgi:hypothetical protein
VSGTIAKLAENPFEPPKARVGAIESEFRSSVWKRGFAAGISGLLGFSIWEIAVASRSEELTFVLWCLAVGSFLWLLALGNVLQIRARHGPAIRACREGVLVRLTQRSQIPEIPSAPGSIGMVWDLLNGRGARLPVANVLWENIEAIGVTRLGWRRILAVQVNSDHEKGGSFFLVVPQSELRRSVRRVAVSLNTFFHQPDRRAGLNVWVDADSEQRPSFKIS